jgi:FkbM family methyltransferase
MDFKWLVRRAFRSVGYDLQRYSELGDAEARRGRLLRAYGVDVVLDVGANTGQFARELRRAGYAGRIESFEPQGAAFRALEQRAAADPRWKIHRMAVGDRDGTATLNLAGNSLSSSLLEMLPAHADSAPESRYVGTEEVPTRRLDGLFDALAPAGSSVFLKIDTQGFERQVLDGAAGCLARIDTVQVEMSLVSLYAGAPLFGELLDRLQSLGYDLVGLEPGFAEPATGRLLQTDGIFHRHR